MLGLRLSRWPELRSNKVNKSAHRRRQMARLRINEPDRLDVRPEFVQHRNEFSLRDSGIGEIVLQLCESITGAGGVTDCSTVAETHIPLRCEAFFNTVLQEKPCSREARFVIRKRQAIVLGPRS